MQLETSKVDSKDIPSYWCKFSEILHPDNFSRNVWEESILTRIYTEEDARKLRTDIDVLSLPRRIYCDTEITLRIISHKLSQCHIGTSINWKELFIQA